MLAEIGTGHRLPLLDIRTLTEAGRGFGGHGGLFT